MGLKPGEYIPWTLCPAVEQRTVAQRVEDGAHVVTYRDPSDHKADVLIGAYGTTDEAAAVVDVLRGITNRGLPTAQSQVQS